jgi:hypothetical protein
MMSIALAMKVEQLAKRVEALERAAGRAAPLRRLNAERKADGARLRKAIDRILATHPEFTAKHVLRALPLAELGRTEPPSVRALQWHIKAIRATNSQSSRDLVGSASSSRSDSCL